jgi:hypothetical protein
MVHATIDGNFETAEQAIENVLNTQVAKKGPVNGLHPVCVKWQMSKRVTRYGMQFWTLETIGKGECQNSDMTKSILC